MELWNENHKQPLTFIPTIIANLQ